MKRKKLFSWLVILLAAAVLAVTCELALDCFVNWHIVEEVRDKSVYQLFPDGDPVYVDCAYSDGMLVPQSGDPQMVWTVSHDATLADLTVRFSEPITEACEIQVYYDDTGEGFSAEKALSGIAAVGATEACIPLERANYYALRVDINGTVPLSGIDCDASVVLTKKVAGPFRVDRCLIAFAAFAAILFMVFKYLRNDAWHGAINTYGAFLASDIAWAFLVSVGIGVYFSLYYHLRDMHTMQDVVKWMLHPFWPVVVASFLVLYGGIFVARRREIPISDWLYEKRWLLGACLLALCVLLNLNNSSLHEWAGYLGTQDVDGVLIGVTRGIRSDEWVKGIGVIKALSFENYPVYSKLIRATSTENVLIAGHVAWDISALFRPTTWGYLLLGSVSRGLSFSQYSAIIALFLLSFDFFMMVSGNRKLSFAFASVMLFSPFVQWWTCFDLFISSFAVLLAGKRFLTTDSLPTKLLSAAVVTVFGGCFALVLYPAWQVPAAYFLLAGIIWVIIKNRRDIKWRTKVDLPIILGALAFLAVCGFFIYRQSAAAIHDMVNTVYPGTVRVSAPTSTSKLFMNYLNVFSQYTSQYVPGPNLSEAADFVTFFPIGILLCLYAMIRERKVDAFSVIMILLSAFLAVFTFMDVSEFLRKVTFMSFSMSQRILPWFSFVQVLLLFRGVSLLKRNVRWYFAIPVAALFSWFITRRIADSGILAGQALLLGGMAALMFIVPWAAMRAGKNERTLRLFSTIMVFFALYSAGMVHPVQVGMAEIEESEIVMKIQAIAEEDPSGKWLVENLSYPYGMVPLMGGAPTINCVNNYPNLELWYKMDPERDDEYAYNRYVSQIVTSVVNDEDTTFNVGWVDDIMDLRVNVRDLKTMEVSYILTNRELERYSTDDVAFTRVASAPSFIIYHVGYSGGADE